MSAAVAAGAVLVMFLWAVCFPLIQVGLEASPPMWFAGLRALVAGLVLLAGARLVGRPPMRGAGVWRADVLVGLTATSLGFFGMFYGGGLVSPGLRPWSPTRSRCSPRRSRLPRSASTCGPCNGPVY